MRPRSLVVTGASAGIGRALALHYAAPGTLIGLVGRNRDALAETARACTDRGASTTVAVRDVRDREGLAADLLRHDEEHPIDLLLANAGIALPERNDAAARAILATNLDGALNTVLPLLPRMVARRSGQIAFVSSLAALQPLADAPAYSASKAALLAYGMALRERHARDGLRVSVTCPGFIATGMGARYSGARPFEMSAADAARRIAAGLARNKGVIAFPRPMVLAIRAAALLPERLRRLGTAGFRFTIDDQG